MTEVHAGLLSLALSLDPSQPAETLPAAFLEALSERLHAECVIIGAPAQARPWAAAGMIFPSGMAESSCVALRRRLEAPGSGDKPFREPLGELGELVIFPSSATRADPELRGLPVVARFFAQAWESAITRERAQAAVAGFGIVSAAAHIGFWTLDLDREWIRFTPECLRLLRLPANVGTAIRYAAFLEWIHPDDRPRVAATLEHYTAKGFRDPLEFQFRFEDSDGVARKLKAFVGHPVAVPDSQAGVAGLFLDVTETELARSGQLDRSGFEALILSLTMELINAPVEKIDEVIVSVLKQGAEFVGADRAYRIDYEWQTELSSNTHEWCAHGVEPQIEKLQGISVAGLELWTRSHRNGLPFFISSVQALDPAHPIREILEPQGIKSIVTLPLMAAEQCFGFIGFDAVGAQRHWSEVEVALLRLLAQLIENAEERRHRELDLREALSEQRRAKEAAQEMALIADQANEAKSRFVATVSHEIRTPLHAILGMTELLGHAALNFEQRGYLETLAEAGRNLSVLVEDMLDFARIETGKIVIEKKPFDLKNLATRVVEQVRSQAASKRLEVSYSIDPRLPENVIGDELRVRQIVFNLVQNAVKYTERGRVDLFVNLAPPQAQGAVCVVFMVSDTGIGIAPEDLEHLFRPFYQGEAAIELRNTGTGLGLSIVHNLVSIMNGTIHVDSVLDQGTTFTVRLWFEESGQDALEADPGADLPAPVAAGPGDTRDLKGVRVLLAEDNLMNQMLVRAHLRDQGCELVVVENGREAVLACAREAFDLVLMDCRMPVMDGFEATREIRAADASMASVPIVAVTANAMRGDMDRCTAVGMTDFLGKPFTREQLLEVIRNALSNRGPRPELDGTD